MTLTWVPVPGQRLTFTAANPDGGSYQVGPIRARDSVGTDYLWAMSFGDYQVTCSSLNDAKAAAEADYSSTHRANLWRQYMANYDPPTVISAQPATITVSGGQSGS